MSALAAALRNTAPAPSNPWPRYGVDAAQWLQLAAMAAAGDVALLSLWGEKDRVNLALMDAAGAEIVIASLDCPDGSFPSVAAIHPPAQRLERTIADVYGLIATGSTDERPWLDHGRWGVKHPGGSAPAFDGKPEPYDFATAEGAPLHQIPVGPVHAGIIEPGHFRFTANGETVVRLEERLGYVHKGVESLMRSACIENAARIAARISGDSTVAYSFAFAFAVEAALAIEAPARAQALRVVVAELERVANHLGDIGAICNDAAFTLFQAHCHVWRERLLRVSADSFGHRLMMDVIAPGGVTHDLNAAGAAAILALLAEMEPPLAHLRNVYDNVNSLQDRTARTGIVSRNLVEQYGAGGYVGRGSGRAFDARAQFPYGAYRRLNVLPVTRTAGDVDARVWVRFDEIAQSIGILRTILRDLPDGDILSPLASLAQYRDGFALVEAFRGDLFAHVRVGPNGVVEHAHMRDASWFQWPLLEAAIEGNIVADFPLCNKSFNCSYSGHDL